MSHSHSSSSQTDPVRSAAAQRAAEMMLSSSLASSVNSLASQTPSLPSYHSQPPPAYGSYQQYPHPQHQAPAGHPHHPVHPQSYPHPQGMRMPPHLSHLHYSTGGGYRSQQFPVIMTDDLVSGTQHGGRMSPVRRFFVLLCTFDILFTSLLWIIAILVTGRDLTRELHQQVVEYTIHSSMFDTVVAAAGRLVVPVSQTPFHISYNKPFLRPSMFVLPPPLSQVPDLPVILRPARPVPLVAYHSNNC